MEASGCRIIEYPDKNAEFSIYDVADQHLLNRGSSMSHILKDRDRIAEDDYALWFEGGDYCLPESAEVLTKRGFVKGIDLASTDMVLGYEHGKTRWVKVNNKFIIKNAELISFGSYSFAATCTENHRWLCRSGRGKESYCTLNEINTGQGIVVSAPCVEDGDINITPTEASLLGWLITDGCVRTLSKNSFNAGIAQSPRKYLDVIKKEFKELITGEYSVANSDCSQINLATKKVRELFNKIGICHETIKDDLLKIVARFPQLHRDRAEGNNGAYYRKLSQNLYQGIYGIWRNCGIFANDFRRNEGKIQAKRDDVNRRKPRRQCRGERSLK